MESLIPLLFVFVLAYLMLIRPQQKRLAAQRSLHTSLSVGDEVVTVGGLLGRIVAIDETSATIETLPGTLLRMRREAISGKTGEASPGSPATTNESGPIDLTEES